MADPKQASAKSGGKILAVIVVAAFVLGVAALVWTYPVLLGGK